MIKPKYRKNLDPIQLARAGVEQAIGAPLTLSKPSSVVPAKIKPKPSK